MNLQKQSDSQEVVEFLALFSEVRRRVDDDPARVSALAGSDTKFKTLCDDLGLAATCISLSQGRSNILHTAPVNPAFVDAWRDFQNRFDAAVSDVCWGEILKLLPDNGERLSPPEAALHYAQQKAGEVEIAVESAIHLTDDDDAADAWDYLRRAGLDVRGIVRRRELLLGQNAFTLIPRHVARHHGREYVSLLVKLEQAQQAYVFGAFHGALAVMRAILELVLRRHYSAFGENLEALINNCNGLPPNMPVSRLHRLRGLANIAMHETKLARRSFPQSLESELPGMFLLLRDLIERAPDLES